MPRKKHLKIARVRNLPNVFEHSQGIGKGWHQRYFKNNRPVTLELGCGSGMFTLQHAELTPENFFVGVDIKGARIWRGAHCAIDAALTNVAFLRAPVEFLTQCFGPGDVGEIWLTFPDPYPKKYNTNRRLTSAPYLAQYREILSPKGLVHLKTDNRRLFDFTLRTIVSEGWQVIRKVVDLHNNCPSSHPARFLTDYEKKYLAEKRVIYYLNFCYRL